MRAEWLTEAIRLNGVLSWRVLQRNREPELRRLLGDAGRAGERHYRFVRYLAAYPDFGHIVSFANLLLLLPPEIDNERHSFVPGMAVTQHDAVIVAPFVWPPSRVVVPVAIQMNAITTGH